MMEAWENAAKPGPQHQWLARKAGRWEFAGKFWMDPTKPPTESVGTVERELMLGGRVLAEKVRSTYMDKPFEGYGLTGYDNVSKEFWGTWNDNMGTGIMLSTGQCDNRGACTHSGSYMDAMTNAKKTVRMKPVGCSSPIGTKNGFSFSRFSTVNGVLYTSSTLAVPVIFFTRLPSSS